jgi:hypothetical protein
MGLSSRNCTVMLPMEVMRRTRVPLVLYSPAGEAKGVAVG